MKTNNTRQGIIKQARSKCSPNAIPKVSDAPNELRGRPAENILRENVFRNLSYRFPERNIGEYIFPIIFLGLSIGLLVCGGIYGSWTSIVSGIVLLIFLGRSWE